MIKHCIAAVLLIFSVASPAGAFPVEITHDAGTLTLTRKPERIAALNWTQAEILLTLGIVPVGVTSIQGYKKWQGDFPPMPDGVAELGSRAEPSMESIAALQPDLILGYNWRHAKILPRLRKIAPTLLYKQYPSAGDASFNYYDQMINMFNSVATATGRRERAGKILRDLNAAVTASRETIARSGVSHPLVIGKFVGMGLGLRVYGENSMAGCIIRKAGLTPGWSSTLPGRDFTHIELAQLPGVGNASLMLIGGDLSEAMNMKNSPVWQLVPAVRENRTYDMEKLWSFGGPVAAMRMLDAITSSVAGERR